MSDDTELEITPGEWASRLQALLEKHPTATPSQLHRLLEEFIDDVQMNVYLATNMDLACFFVGRFEKLEQVGATLDISMTVLGDDGNAVKNFAALRETPRGVVVVSREASDGDRRVREAKVKRGHN